MFSDASSENLRVTIRKLVIYYFYIKNKFFSPIAGIHRKQRECLKVLLQLRVTSF